jgi:hypothetical protein
MQLQKDPDGDKDNPNNGQNDDNGDDDGQGHQFILSIAGHTYLYTLDRAVDHIDSDDLYIHELTPEPGLPLNGAPRMNDGPTDSTTGQRENAFHTHGLVNPDGILGCRSFHRRRIRDDYYRAREHPGNWSQQWLLCGPRVRTQRDTVWPS